MALENVNPTQTKAWKNLTQHVEQIREVHMKSLFQKQKDRKEKMRLTFEEISLDYSRNRLTEETLDYLFGLAKESKLNDAIEKYFCGDIINQTENRAVLHTALRNQKNEPVYVDGKDVMPEVRSTLSKIKSFSDKVIKGELIGYSGKPFTDVVNIGIGGSDLGPRMVVEGLHFYKNHLNVHFVSNIDGDHVYETLKKLNPETTLFVIVSKTFTTQETLTNALTIQDWFLKSAKQSDIKYNFVAVSTNLQKVKDFGIAEENIFTMWDWVGGRYSLWSAVGISISLAIGYERFESFLKGAYAMDEHFRKSPFEKNLPINPGPDQYLV